MSEIVKDVSAKFTGTAVLFQHDGKFYVASHANVPFSGPETLVFPADADGEITSWGEVAGGRGMSIAEAIADLEDQGRE